MEETKRRLPPSLPANYVSFLDLRERWMKQQQQKKQEEGSQQKELQRKPEIQEELKRAEEKSKGGNHQEEEPPLDESSFVHSNPNPSDAIRRPPNGNRRQGDEGNYRWIEVSQAKPLDVLPPKQAPSPPIKAGQSNKPAPVVQVKAKCADKSRPPPSSDVPKFEAAAQASGETHGSGKEVNDRKFNSGNSKKANARNKRTCEKEDLVQSRLDKGVLSTKGDLEGKSDAKIQEKPKAVQVLQANQLKPAPVSESGKAETAGQVPGEIHGSDKEVNDRKRNNRKGKKANARNRKGNQQVNLVQSQPEKGVLAPKADSDEKANVKVQLETAPPVIQSNPPPLEVLKVDCAVKPPARSSDGVVDAPKVDRAKVRKPYNRRNQKLKKDAKEKGNPEVEAVRETKDANDSSRAQTEGKVAGVSLTSAPVESCSRGSIATKNRKGWRKDGSYAKFERRAILKTERARCEGSLVWVKKGESPQIGAVTVENAGNIME